MALQYINPPGLAPAGAPYALGTKAGNLIHTAGILPVDASGSVMAPGDVQGQTRFVLQTIQKILQAAGTDLHGIAFNHVFLTDVKDFAGMNAVYREFFGTQLPARYCVRADFVKEGCLVEIASVAYAG